MNIGDMMRRKDLTFTNRRKDGGTKVTTVVDTPRSFSLKGNLKQIK